MLLFAKQTIKQTKASIALRFFKKTKFFWLFALQTKASVALRLRFGFLKKQSFFGCLLCKQKLRLRFGCASIALCAKQSKAKQSKAKQSKAKQSKAKQRKTVIALLIKYKETSFCNDKDEQKNL